jgi:hypothetical protein
MNLIRVLTFNILLIYLPQLLLTVKKIAEFMISNLAYMET